MSGETSKSGLLVGTLKGLLGVGSGGKQTTQDPQVATCAILLEMAESDQDFDPTERGLIESMLKDHFGLDEEQVRTLVAETEKERARATDLFPFTRTIAELYTPDMKRDLLVMVWRVIFADGRLSPYEDQLAHRLQRMLAVNHSLLMDAKRLAREQAPQSP